MGKKNTSKRKKQKRNYTRKQKGGEEKNINDCITKSFDDFFKKKKNDINDPDKKASLPNEFHKNNRASNYEKEFKRKIVTIKCKENNDQLINLTDYIKWKKNMNKQTPKMDPIEQFARFFTDELKKQNDSSTKKEDPCKSALTTFNKEKEEVNDSKNTIPVKKRNIDRAYVKFSSKCKDRNERKKVMDEIKVFKNDIKKKDSINQFKVKMKEIWDKATEDYDGK